MKKDIGLIISIFLAFFLLLVLVSQASAAPSITSWSSSGGTTQNKDNAQDIMYLVLQGDSITFSITATGATSYKWFVNKIDQNNNADTFAWTVPNQKGIWEIRVEASDGTPAPKEWVVSTLTNSEAPDFFDYFTDGNFTGIRTDADPWGRSLKSWNVIYSGFSATNQYLSQPSLGAKIEVNANAGVSGTWIFWDLVTKSDYAYTSFSMAKSTAGNYYEWTHSGESHDYFKLQPADLRIDHDTGMFDKPYVWAKYTFIRTNEGYVYLFQDDAILWAWGPDNDYGTVPTGMISFDDKGNNAGHQIDGVLVYKDRYIFPELYEKPYYGSYASQWRNNPSNYFYEPVNKTGIIVRGWNVTLKDIYDSINDASKFDYNQATRTAIVKTNLFVKGGSKLVIDNETLKFDLQSDGQYEFGVDGGVALEIKNSTITTTNNPYFNWRFASPTHYGWTWKQNKNWVAYPQWSSVIEATYRSYMGRIIIDNSTINNSAYFYISAPIEFVLKNSNFTNMHQTDTGEYNYEIRQSEERRQQYRGNKSIYIYLHTVETFNFTWSDVKLGSSPDEKVNATFMIANEPYGDDQPGVPGGVDVQRSYVNIYNSNFSDAGILLKPAWHTTVVSWCPRKDLGINDGYCDPTHDTRVGFVNSLFDPKNVYLENDPYLASNSVFINKYYLDVLAEWSAGSAVDGATVTVLREQADQGPKDDYYPENMESRRIRSEDNPGWVSNPYYGKHMGISYRLFPFSQSNSTLTGSDGRTPLPSDKARTIVIPDYIKESGTQTNFTYTIIVSKGGKTATITGVNPDETWYRPNPQIPTVTVKCNIDTGTWQLVGPDLGSFSGTIKDADNNPIAGVTVSCLGSTIQTDSNGDYLLSNILVGSRDVSAFKSGYIAQTTTANVVKDQTTTGVNFTLNPAPPNNAPTLSWSGETDYTSDGLNPEAGTTATTFTFRAKYSDADNDAPAAGYPRVHIQKGGVEIAGSPFTMTADDSNAYNLGRKYTYSTKLTAGTDYSYYFEALDLNSVIAAGAPTTVVDAPDVTTSADNQPPSVAISSPLDGQIFNSAAISIVGTTNDNVGVDKVEVKVGDATWQAASGITSWNKEVTLVAGTNLISVRVTDTSGNIKETSITVTYRAEEQELLEQKIKVYPNPYIRGKSSSERISFSNLPSEAMIKIYNTSGKLVKELISESGNSAEWDIGDVGSGVYLYVIASPEVTKKEKISIIK